MNTGVVKRTGTTFTLNGAPFRFVGTNAYYLAIMHALGSPAHALDQIAAMKALGFTVARTWGYADGPNDGVGDKGFQPRAGEYNEAAFHSLDVVLAECDRAGIRVIISLVDGNSSYGGVGQYLAWTGGGAERDFYQRAACRDLYKAYVAHVLQRTNTVNGRKYAEDPTVLAWELANEPHIQDRQETSGQVLRAWVREMAAYVKGLDPNHLVSDGSEGYDITTAGYSPVSSAYSGQGWLFDGNKGCAWSENTADPNIDYASVHVYPEFWNLSLEQGSTWIADHLRIARALGKPLVVGEMGASANTAAAFRDWLDTWDAGGGAGVLAWQVMAPVAIGMGDQFKIPTDSDVARFLGGWAARVVAPVPPPPPPPPPPPVVNLEPRVLVLERALAAQTTRLATLDRTLAAEILRVDRRVTDLIAGLTAWVQSKPWTAAGLKRALGTRGKKGPKK